MTPSLCECRCDGNPAGGSCSYPDCQMEPPATEELLGEAAKPDGTQPRSRIAELVEAIQSELRPVYHVTPGGLKWSLSTDALRELVELAKATGVREACNDCIELGCLTNGEPCSCECRHGEEVFV